jgi:hypothetical protein
VRRHDGDQYSRCQRDFYQDPYRNAVAGVDFYGYEVTDADGIADWQPYAQRDNDTKRHADGYRYIYRDQDAHAYRDGHAYTHHNQDPY